jgi:ABC-2 type transport system ATP-binding protein
MPDYFGTYQNVNVLEYLDFFARAYGLVGRERINAIGEALEFTQLGPLSHKPIDGLSKGMKQRLCLGRTIIHNPSVLILDEPAAGLDPRARIELRDMIARLAEAGKAILISSHILTELAEISDRVGILEQGRLLAVGSVAEISSGVQTRSTVRVRALDNNEKLRDWLRARNDIEELHSDGERLLFMHSGSEQSEAALLHEMILAGFSIIEFGAKHKSLEDVFLHVTEGRVQ